MSWRDEMTVLAMAIAILLAGATIGAAAAMAARSASVPTTSAAIFVDGVECPVNP